MSRANTPLPSSQLTRRRGRKTCVVAREPTFNRREIVNILVYDFAKFVMLRQAGVADDREEALNVRVEQTLAQDALPDHARRSEENHFHLNVSYFSRRRIPERVRRPSAAREAGILLVLLRVAIT